MTDERKNEIWAMLPRDFKQEVIEWVKACDDDGDDDVKYILAALFGAHILTAQAEEKPKKLRYKVGDKVIVNGRFVSEIFDIDIKSSPKYPYHIHKPDGYYCFFAESDLEPYIPQNAETSDLNAQNCEMPTGIGISDSKIQSESAESVETSANSRSANHIPDVTKMVTPNSEPKEDVETSTIDGTYFTYYPQNYNNSNHIVGKDNNNAKAKELANSFQSFTDWNKYRLDLAKEIAVAIINSGTLSDGIANDSVNIANEIVKRLKETEI